MVMIKMSPAEVQGDAQQGASYRRLSVNVAEDVAGAIDQMRTRHRWSITEVIRRAVSILKFIDEEEAHGGRVLVERDGKVREVKFL
jgi:hypothetical protein